ncbi:hypothetical protein GGER_32610 [Serratia rubidaea]
MDIAKAYDSGFGIVQVDLNKVNVLQVQVWEHAPRTTGIDGLAYHRSIWTR